ncbi:ABC transporter permease subunit [Rhodobacteraceae bacterium RKSG542]|uniref:ABC transporter permease n=1 Tax=Pseudovibrio flavus TaxID=2529854 RepID=UPI0012BB6039|nr:ABC transporter permease subunit [Pseudovibrio flavus]MTI17357.1 ABC transporter permease subunit [Pseudovibrio flavus]
MLRAVISLAVFLGLWTLACELFQVPSYLVPNPLELVEKFWFLTTKADLFSHIPITVTEILIGFVIGTFAGVFGSVVFFRVPAVELLLNPVIVFIQTAPKIAIAPLLLLWLGLDMTPKIVLVAIVTFFPVLSNMLSALRSMNPEFNSLAQILCLSPWQRLIRIELPQSLPLLFAGMKVGATLAVTAAVIGELMGARGGLGYLLSLGQETADVSMVLVSVLLLSLIGYLLSLVIELIEKKYLNWHESV